MPCACKNPQPDYPETANWGPILWKILHALAERGGKTFAPSFREDERRQWQNIIPLLPKIIPCPDCRNHAEAWILLNPITALKTLSESEMYDWLTDWFYRFHENVNQRIGKPSFDKAMLSQTYGSISIAGAMRRLKPFIETAIRLSGITILPWQKWTGYVVMLSSYYGI
jgi:hypothetical protein